MTLNTATLFNAALGAASLVAAHELDLLDEVDRHAPVDLRRFSSERALNFEAVQGIARALACVDVLSVDEAASCASAGAGFRQALRDMGFFLWLVGGYGYALQHLAALTRTATRAADQDDRSFVMREPRYIALAGKSCGANYVDYEFEQFLSPAETEVVCDLGCGAATRLINLVTKYPGVRGVGVDIDPAMVQAARASIESAGVADRIRIVRDDVRNLAERDEFHGITVLTSFFMGHDLWPKDRCLTILARLRKRFPAAARFLLCDTFNCEPGAATKAPIFCLGFELIHAVMGQRIPTSNDWLEVFSESAWQYVGQRPLGMPFTAVFDLRPR